MTEQAIHPSVAHADHSVVIFDGVCNFCNTYVNYVIDRDPADRFRFASLQSEAGESLAGEHGIDA
ncbi:MAG: thiol-disulfide oxidoreductase DCC family protein, partial [Phycisphaeraceae bacterium]